MNAFVTDSPFDAYEVLIDFWELLHILLEATGNVNNTAGPHPELLCSFRVIG
ncbi:hypothetical protein D3C85_1098400 [compost metagenome]